jgi:hypothetical protein
MLEEGRAGKEEDSLPGQLGTTRLPTSSQGASNRQRPVGTILLGRKTT